jgi:mxaK protein
MKRRYWHAAFAAGAMVLGALAVRDVLELRHAHRVNAAIVAHEDATTDSTLPEARFTHAVRSARAGEYDQAASAYKELARSERADLRRAALLNLGNLHLREAVKHGTDAASQWLPMIELAKQSYRTLLRENPQDWSARYNLEHALRLAPELDESAVTVEGPPPDSERTTSTISSSRMELP